MQSETETQPIAALVEELMEAHDREYDEIVCDPEADDTEVVAALIVRLLHDLQARGVDADVEWQAVTYMLRWYFGEAALQLMSELGPELEEMALHMRRTP
jgi:hypothetical protein